MSLLLQNSEWKLLKHLHQQLAQQQAIKIAQGEEIQPRAYLVSPARGDDPAQLAELSNDFISGLLDQEDGQRLLAQYLASALQPGSSVQAHIADAYGFQARYTLSCQEAFLPLADDSDQQEAVLMVLLHGQGFAMPVFHSIHTIQTQGDQDRQERQERRCHLRPFPELEEFQSVQNLLRQRMQQGSALH